MPSFCQNTTKPRQTNCIRGLVGLAAISTAASSPKSHSTYPLETDGLWTQAHRWFGYRAATTLQCAEKKPTLMLKFLRGCRHSALDPRASESENRFASVPHSDCFRASANTRFIFFLACVAPTKLVSPTRTKWPNKLWLHLNNYGVQIPSRFQTSSVCCPVNCRMEIELGMLRNIAGDEFHLQTSHTTSRRMRRTIVHLCDQIPTGPKENGRACRWVQRSGGSGCCTWATRRRETTSGQADANCS